MTIKGSKNITQKKIVPHVLLICCCILFLSFANITYTMCNKIYKKARLWAHWKNNIISWIVYCNSNGIYPKYICMITKGQFFRSNYAGIGLLYLIYSHVFHIFYKSLLLFNISLYFYCLETFIVHNITLSSLPSSSSSSILYPKNSSNFCDTTYASCYASDSQFLSWVSKTTITKKENLRHF